MSRIERGSIDRRARFDSLCATTRKRRGGKNTSSGRKGTRRPPDSLIKGRTRQQRLRENVTTTSICLCPVVAHTRAPQSYREEEIINREEASANHRFPSSPCVWALIKRNSARVMTAIIGFARKTIQLTRRPFYRDAFELLILPAGMLLDKKSSLGRARSLLLISNCAGQNVADDLVPKNNTLGGISLYQSDHHIQREWGISLSCWRRREEERLSRLFRVCLMPGLIYTAPSTI